MNLSHDELVAEGAKYLAKTHVIVLTELTFGYECPDVIGWDRNGRSTVIECETTLSDYRADAHKPFRIVPSLGMGARRYFLTNAGLISTRDWKESNWGLLEVKNGRFKKRKATRLFTPNLIHENQLLITSVRRMGDQNPKGTSVNFYKIDRQVRSTLGVL